MGVPTSEGVPSGLFPTTIWSEVRPRSGERSAALEVLARRYQAPAEAFLRAALGLSGEEAHELFQDFFVRVLEGDFLERADPARGRFRAFLKVALRRFWTDELRRRAASKRGGGEAPRALDAVPEPAEGDAAGPEAALDAAWRAALIDEAFERTRAALERDGRAAQFAVFRDFYLAPGFAPEYRTLAERHGLTTTDVSNFLMRAKRRFREELRALVLDTVRGADDLDGELAWLLEDGA